MRTITRTAAVPLAFCAALLLASNPVQAAIESNFDDQVYPGAAGGGWVGGWQNTAIGSPAILPQILTASPLSGSSPYLNFDATGAAVRNVMRQYDTGEGVNIATAHLIRWKFRLVDADFENAFSVSNDRVHFFGRNAPRLANSTDASISWSIVAAGAVNAGAWGGKTFWLFDNVDGTGAFNAVNNLDTFVPLIPGNIYSFEVAVDPAQRTYTAAITNETSSAWFKSATPHRFRNLGVEGSAHTYLHFGVQASAAAEPRAFDLDSVSIAPSARPAFENVVPSEYAIYTATGGIHFNVAALEPVAAGSIGLRLNGSDVSAQLNISGPETNRSVSYSGLTADTVYDMILTATNASGSTSLTRRFYTATGPFTLYNSEGFTSDLLYPVGPLQPVTHGTATWVPSTEPSDILDLADGQHGKVLQRMNMAATRVDYLQFSPVSSGVITIEFDASVSTTSGRTFDIALMTASGAWASHVAWGAVPQKLAYYNPVNADWLPVADLPAEWHHCKLIHYLSGAAAGRYDLLVNNTPVAEKVLWRGAVPGMPLSQMSYQSHSSGPPLEYGFLDNLVVTAAPEDPNAFPTPTITNVSPALYAVARPAEGLRFEVVSVLPITGSDISVVLNGSNISSGLTITGSGNRLLVSYGPLSPGRQIVEITATNGAGPASVTHTFYATLDSMAIFDSGGFTDEVLYPVGYLTAVTNDGSRWVPATQPAEIVDLADGQHGKVLRRAQVGPDQTDYLLFPPVSSGAVEIELDARVSVMEGRLIDLSLNSVTANGGGTQGPFIMWATNALNYYNRTAWIALAPLDTSWHRVKLTCYVSGTKAGTFDASVDGAAVGQGLVWRNVFSPVGTLRLGAIRGTVLDYGEVDNLIIRVAPEPIAALPVTLLSPVHNGSVFSFKFQSVDGVNYRPQYNAALSATGWTDLDPVQGDGAEKTVTHTNPPAGTMFYRVQSTLP